MNRTTTFRQLNAIDAIARLGGVSRAAEELHITQPTVSLQIKLLEEAIGAPLLQRAGRGAQLTPAGEVMAGYAGQILRLWREATEEVAALKEKVAALELENEKLLLLTEPFVEQQLEQLEQLEYDDPHSVLLQVPGVYVRTEDQWGNRTTVPNRWAGRVLRRLPHQTGEGDVGRLRARVVLGHLPCEHLGS